MHNTQAAQMWHLGRGKQTRVLISDHELRLLAQQGRLRADDLLWKRGFDGWRTAFSISGLLTPPPLPATSLASVNDDKNRLQADVTESAATFTTKLLQIGTLSARLGTKATSWFHDLLALINKCLRWIRYCLKIAGRNVSKLAKRASAGSETLLSQVEHPRVLACLLAAAVGVGTLDIVMQSSFANSAVALPKYQDRPPEREATSASLSTLKLGWPIFPEAAGNHTLVDYAFSSFQPTTSKDSIEAVEAAEPTQSSADAPVPQETAELETVPLPTRKPKKGTASPNNLGSERAYVAPKRLSQAQRRQNGQPKPMRFGTIGFNYADPGM
jgi:hypothetical protein